MALAVSSVRSSFFGFVTGWVGDGVFDGADVWPVGAVCWPLLVAVGILSAVCARLSTVAPVSSMRPIAKAAIANLSMTPRITAPPVGLSLILHDISRRQKG